MPNHQTKPLLRNIRLPDALTRASSHPSGDRTILGGPVLLNVPRPRFLTRAAQPIWAEHEPRQDQPERGCQDAIYGGPRAACPRDKWDDGRGDTEKDRLSRAVAPRAR